MRLASRRSLSFYRTIRFRRERLKIAGFPGQDDVKGRFADLKQASADRCPRLLGTIVKAAEVQFHHEVYNQFLWNLF